MKNRRGIGLLIAFICSVAFMCALYFVSGIWIARANAFVRKLPPHLFEAERLLDLKNNHFYICGGTGDEIYLGSNTYKNLLLTLDVKTFKLSETLLPMPNSFVALDDAYMSQESNTIYLLDGAMGKVTEWSCNTFARRKEINVPTFNESLTLSSNSFIFRGIDRANNNILIKKYLGRKLIVNDQLLKNQQDGIFSTDGFLFRAGTTGKIFYVYYYRNEFIAADSNLNQIYSGKTIDTNKIAKIKIGRIHSNQRETLSSPPLFVNKHGCANNEYLFIESALKADNESDRTHIENASIDVYNVQNGKYQFSFYLPDLGGEKLTDLKVYGKTLAALFGHYFYTFQLNF